MEDSYYKYNGQNLFVSNQETKTLLILGEQVVKDYENKEYVRGRLVETLTDDEIIKLLQKINEDISELDKLNSVNSGVQKKSKNLYMAQEALYRQLELNNKGD